MDDDAFEFWKHHGLERLAQKFVQEEVTALTDAFLLWKHDMNTQLGMSLGARIPLGKSCRGLQAADGISRSGAVYISNNPPADNKDISITYVS